MKAKNKKPVKTLAKYAMGSGSGGVIKGYMPDPNEVFAQNNIDIAKAQYEASTNPWVMGGKALGAAAMGYGMNQFSSGGGIQKAALGTGPMGAGGVAIETEEGEILEDPSGKVTKESGKKHTEGGNQKVVTPGTTIFSDQLKVAGKTMAERKLTRERELTKLTKAVEKDPSDMLSKNTLKEMASKFEIEEQQDLQVQEFASQIDDAYNYAMGTGKYGVQKFAYGTPPQGLYPMTEQEAYVNNFPVASLDIGVPPILAGNPVEKATGNPDDDWWAAEADSREHLGYAPLTPDKGEVYKTANANLSLGDMLGMGSSLYGGFAAMANTRKNMAGTQVNENEFRDFGIDALQANEDATKFLSGQQEKALTDINLDASSAVISNRNSARGVNQNRALNAGVFVNANKAKADVYDNFSKQMMGQLNTKAGLENMQDQMVMQGAGIAKGLNDEDWDNYWTQLGADKQGLANMGMNLGKSLNVQKGNQDFLNMLPDLSAYGLGYTTGKDGKMEIQKITK